jgi:hypothetical protein
LIVRAIRDGSVPVWFIIDGKAGADYASLEDRQGVVTVGYEPADWDRIFRYVIEQIMRARYAEARAYEAGRGPKPPEWPRVGILIDEVQAVREGLGAKVFDAYINELVRLIRAARGTVVIATQRPDVRDSLPGAVRDNLVNRIVCGWMSRTGAEMLLDTDWRWITGDPDSDVSRPQSPPGRAVARINGRLFRLQVPYLPSPVRESWADPLYPPRKQPDPPDAPDAPTPASAPPSPPPDLLTLTFHQAPTPEPDPGPERTPRRRGRRTS